MPPRPLSSLALLCFLMSACATKQVVINPTFDFSKVRRISVAPFDGPGGPAASDELVRQLVGQIDGEPRRSIGRS